MNARAHARAPRALTQLLLLLGLWWRYLRRRPMRVGDAPKQGGVPTFLLINLLSLAYILPTIFASVSSNLRDHRAFFAWHALGVLALGLGAGLGRGAGTLQVRGGRNDEFLLPLPISSLARLGLQLADGYVVVLMALVVPLAGAVALGRSASVTALATLTGLALHVLVFVAGNAAIAWARALGPESTPRYGGYAGAGLVLAGFALLFTPVSAFTRAPVRLAWIADAWLHEASATSTLLGLALLLTLLAYCALRLAERRGFDHVDARVRAPRAGKRGESRAKLESSMVWRQGARVQLVAFGVMLLGGVYLVAWSVPARSQKEAALVLAALAVYGGALQVIAHAGHAVRRDLAARNFLSALPLSPFQVLEGKAGAMRWLLLPVILTLGFVAAFAWQRDALSLTYRALLSIVALLLSVEGAVSVAFMSSGVGVVGVGGGQASSSFSTQLLLLPLLSTLLAADPFSASVSCLAVLAVAWEARRAARHSVRWIDDPDDALERETSVWRALLANTAFFTVQILSGRVGALFQIPPAYLLALSFTSAALVLLVLTWLQSARFSKPAWRPEKAWFWPVGALGGALTATLSMALAQRLLSAPAQTPETASLPESIALALVLVVVAPIAEEYFFRGWLQRAIEQDLPAPHKRWAFALGALAFALAHVGTYGVPQLLLGLVAGFVMAQGRGLGPAMLAHAVHNGVVLAWSQLAPA